MSVRHIAQPGGGHRLVRWDRDGSIAIEWDGRWHAAHIVRAWSGVGLVPDDDDLPISAIVWLEMVDSIAE